MGWNQNSSHSTFDAINFAKNMSETRNAGRDINLGLGFNVDLVSSIWNRLNYSVVGINANAVGATNEKIEAYINKIMTKIDDINATANSDVAFKSEVVKDSVKQYIDKTKEYCINLCSQLRAFEDKLVDVRDEWENSMKNLSGGIDTGKASLDAGSKYEPKRK